MKNKKWISLATAVVLAVTTLPLGVFAAKKDEAKLAKVTLNEVAHSIFSTSKNTSTGRNST